MATVTLDSTPEELELVEEDGAVTRMRRRLLVTGLTSGNYQAAKEALDTIGVPAFNTTPVGVTNLRLTRRSARILKDSPSKAYVELDYTPIGSNDTGFVFHGSSSLRQLTTQNDLYGRAITVSHTFPSGDPDWPNETITQGAEATVLYPQHTLTATGILARDYPISVGARWEGCVNARRWADGPAGRWLCESVSYEPHDMSATPKTWRYTFSFAYDGNGWQPPVIFRDSRDGKPPPNLVAGVGTKTAQCYQYIDFNDLFPV